jgi:SAM-dependent methyltransferase
VENKQYFSQRKGDYQEAVDYIIEHSAESVRQFTSLVNGIFHGKVADFGNGGVILYDTEKLEKLLCVDITNDEKGRIEGNVEFIHGDFYIFDFPADYDFFLAQFLLHHLPDDKRLAVALQRLNGALGSTGKFIVVEMVMPKYMEVTQNILSPVLNGLLRMMKKPGLRFFSLASLAQSLKDAGFEQLTVHNIDITGWTAPAPVLFPKLKMPGWLYPLKCVVIEASLGT